MNVIDCLYEKFHSRTDNLASKNEAMDQLVKSLHVITGDLINNPDCGAYEAGCDINSLLAAYNDTVAFIDIDPKVFSQMIALLVLDQYINAVKLLRKELNVGLKSAKEYVDQFKNEV